ALARYQNLAHEIGVIDQEHVLRREFEIRQIAVLGYHARQELQRMTAERGQVSNDWEALRPPGFLNCCGHFLYFNDARSVRLRNTLSDLAGSKYTNPAKARRNR